MDHKLRRDVPNIRTTENENGNENENEGKSRNDKTNNIHPPTEGIPMGAMGISMVLGRSMALGISMALGTSMGLGLGLGMGMECLPCLQCLITQRTVLLLLLPGNQKLCFSCVVVDVKAWARGTWARGNFD
jgi:hypothetical protein